MKDANYSFTLGVSKNNYKIKPTKFNHIPYQRKEITITQFAEFVINGHLFCHNYKDYTDFNVREKTIDNFSDTKLVWLDFDKSPLTYSEAYDEALIKPAVSYTTMNNSDTDNRFRFIYLFSDSIRSNEEYIKRSNLLLNLVFSKNTMNKIIRSLDKSCFLTSQQFLGSKSDCQFKINPESIVSVELLNNYFRYGKLNVMSSTKKIIDDNFSYSFSFSNHNDNDTNYITNTSNKLGFDNYNELFRGLVMTEFITADCHRFFNSEEIKKKRISLHNKKSMTDIIDSAMKMYRNENFIPLLNNYQNADLSDDIYSYVGDQEIYSINTFFGIDKKVKKGKRIKTLFYQALVLKNIEPTLRPEDVTANLMWLVNHYYEDSNDIKPIEIAQAAINALSTDKGSENCGKKKYLINKDFNALTKPEKIKYLGMARKKKRDNDVLPNYDSNLSVAENARLLNKSIATVYSSLNDNSVKYKNDGEYVRFKELYHKTPKENRTVRKMAEISGLNRGKSERYIRRINTS